MLNENALLKRHVRWYISFALGAFFGALVFISLYGVRILDVTYDDWLLTGWYDLSQHYAGWQLYRASFIKDHLTAASACISVFRSVRAFLLYDAGRGGKAFIKKSGKDRGTVLCGSDTFSFLRSLMAEDVLSYGSCLALSDTYRHFVFRIQG